MSRRGRRSGWKLHLSALTLLTAAQAFAGATPTTSPIVHEGSQASNPNGEYLNSTMQSPGRYFIEVPSGLTRLKVDIWDPDIGAGAGEAALGRDRVRGAFLTTATYELYDPAGVGQASMLGNAAGPSDANWATLFDTVNPMPAFRGVVTNANGADAQTLTIGIPAGSTTGDVLILALAKNNTGTINPVAGWTAVDQNNCAGAGNCRLAIFSRAVTVGNPAPANVTVTWTNNVRAVGVVLAYSGADTTTPINVITTGSGTSTTPTAPTATTTNANTRVVRIYAADNDIGADPYPVNQFGRFNDDDTNGEVVLGVADNAQFAAGATGTAAFALAANQEWRAVTFAINSSGIAVAPMAGHWELRADMTNQGADGDDINAYGIRASDGDVSGGGTEINVYYDSIGGYGVNPPGGGFNVRDYTQYPYITSGCTANKNDFDWDSDSGDTGGISLNSQPAFGSVSPTGSFTQNYSFTEMSQDSLPWRRDSFTGWTSDAIAAGYGMWTMDLAISSYVTPAQNGNYGHVYFGKSSVGANPPGVGANPLPNNTAFRVYFPTDGVTRPAEPYLEQQIRYGGSGGNNGPSPPQNNVESIYTITVRIVNPTSASITFPGSNLVTANVPGNGTVYKTTPGAQVSQGNVISQPGNNGTGNVTWNPGPVLAGTSASLAYRVGITPTTLIPRRIATGTVALNGTQATYVDQTGNTTQGRATYTFGPLCELAINLGTLTPVVVARVQTKQSGEGVVVEFDTASEVGAAGFDVYRWEPATKKWLKINDRLISALVNSPQGGRYQVKDPGASASGRYWYSVREIEIDGPGRAYGPFESTPATENGPSVDPTIRGGRPRKPTVELLAASAASGVTTATAKLKAAKVVTPALKIGVTNTGLVLLPTQTLAEHFGLSVEGAQAALTAGRFNLMNRGHRLAWLPASGGRGLLFYGEAIDSPYERDNVYWLRSANGLIAQPVVSGAPVANDGGVFKGSVHAEIDALPALVVTSNPNSDYWFWDYLNAADAGLSTKSFVVNVPRLGQGLNASLAVNLSSATTSGLKNEHHVRVRVNGAPVADSVWKGIKAQTVKANLGEGLLHEGANTVEVEAILGAGVPTSIVYVDSFDIDYARAFAASDDALAFRGDGAASISVSDFADAHVLVLDLSNRWQPRPLSNVLVEEADGRYRASVVPASAATPYFAVSESGWRAPAWTAGDPPTNLAKAPAADYVVVTTHELVEPAQRLANLRAGSGLTTLVADIQDVYDEYSDGLQDPRAMSAFLKAASKRWSHPPQYLVLAGRGNFDYKNLGGLGGNLVPPLMVSTPKGLFASDTALGDIEDDDGAPEIAVGRIPVLSVEEFDAYIDKLEAYEAAPAPDTARTAVMLADAPDQSIDFGAASDVVAAGLPAGYAAADLHLELDADIAGPRAELFSLLDAGADLVNYSGHGALDRLSAAGLLTSADVPALQNTRTPILTALSCTINRFEVPGFAPLGEELVTLPGHGFVASWAPTGLSIHDEATLLGRAFYRDLGNHSGARLGDAVNSAYRSFIALGGQSWMPDVYSLLGDPALRLKEGVVTEAPGGGSSGAPPE
jgi:hypothetical protein